MSKLLIVFLSSSKQKACTIESTIIRTARDPKIPKKYNIRGAKSNSLICKGRILPTKRERNSNQPLDCVASVSSERVSYFPVSSRARNRARAKKETTSLFRIRPISRWKRLLRRLTSHQPCHSIPKYCRGKARCDHSQTCRSILLMLELEYKSASRARLKQAFLVRMGYRSAMHNLITWASEA